jgi:hypothetical protein
MKLPPIALRAGLLACLLALPLWAATELPFNASLQNDASGNLVLRWPGLAGKHYRIEVSSNLTVWTAVPGEFTGAGAELTSVVRPAGTVNPAKQFWRVVAVDGGIVADGGDGRVELTWATVPGATGYTIKRGPHGGPYTVIGTSATASFTDTGVANGSSYYYVVSATIASGEGANSAEVSVAPIATPAIQAVGLTSTGALHVTWSAAAGASNYTVKYSTVSGGAASGAVGASVAAPGLSCDLVGPVAGTRYYLTVNATNTVGAGSSVNSPEAAGTPLAPFLITDISTTKADSLSVTWSSAGASSYDVLYGSSSGNYTTTLANQVSGVAVPSLKSATPYHFQVRARSESGSITSADVLGMTRANVGIGISGFSYYDHMHALVDMMGGSDFRNLNWQGASLDANGWPTVDFRIILAEGNEPAGDYQLSFKGKAGSLSLDTGGSGSIIGVQYDSGSNTTSAILRMTTPMMGLTSIVAKDTQRTAASSVGSGITNFKIIRPGYPTDGSVLFTAEFITALKKFQCVRAMDYLSINQNPTKEWSERSLMAWAGYGGSSENNQNLDPHYIQFTDIEGTRHRPRGLPWERLIQMANAANVDLWLNVPCLASDDYITKLANLVRYGSDGVNPYTSTQAHPVYPPLNSKLRVYLEYGNEIWNFAGGFLNYGWVKMIAKDIHDNHPEHPVNFDGASARDNEWYTTTMSRYVAYRSSIISLKFREVFGDAAMNTRVRPVLAGQAGGSFSDGAAWASGYYRTTTPSRTVNDLWYGAGGAVYADAGVPSYSTEPALMTAFFQGLPNAAYSARIAGDAMWARIYNLKLIAYEGGPQVGGNEIGKIDASERVQGIYNSDPRMKGAMLRVQRIWDSYDGDLLVYYTLPGQGAWGFGDSTSTTTPLTTMKMQAIDAMNAVERGAVTSAAAVVPGTVLIGPENPGVSTMGGGWNGPGTYVLNAPSDGAGSVYFPIYVETPGIYNITVEGHGGIGAAKVDLNVNGKPVATGIVVNMEGQAPCVPIQTTLVQGLSYVRIGSSADSRSWVGITGLQIAPAGVSIPVPTAPTGLVASSTGTTASLSWNPMSNVSYYKIRRGTSAVVTDYKVSLTTDFADTGLTAGTNYYYEVQAVNGGGASAGSAQVQVRPLATPANITLTTSGTDSLIVRWSPVAGASSYTVKYSSDKGSSIYGVETSATVGQQLTLSGLINGKWYYVRVKATAGNASSYSDEVAAVAGVAGVPFTPPLPPASATSTVGINIGVPSYADDLHWMVDMVRCADFRVQNWVSAVLNMEDGCPTTDFFMIFSGQHEAAGTYKLSFKGKASVSASTEHGAITVANASYDPPTNTTTADIVVSQEIYGISWINFNDTHRTAAAATNTGVTDIHLIRPGYSAGALLTQEFLTAVRKFSVLRAMDFTKTNGNPAKEWSDRPLVKWPGFAGYGGRPERSPFSTTYDGQLFVHGGSWELLIQIANAAGVDLWINIPCRASDDYITKLAQLFRYGSDGVNPYTSVQANPVYPPLNANLKLYVEYGNEIWNTAGGFMNREWVTGLSEAARMSAYHPINYDWAIGSDSGLAMSRFTAYRSATASFAFRKVFGDSAMMTRIRPILASWLANGNLGDGLRWAEGYYAPDYKPNNIWYGGGGAPYYKSSVDASSTDAATMTSYFAGLPEDRFAPSVAADALLTRIYGIKLVAYEGGPELPNNAAIDIAYNADLRMKDRMIEAHKIWNSYGGDLFVYYQMGGAGVWGFGDYSSTAYPTNTPKMQAIDAIRNLSTSESADVGATVASTGTSAIPLVQANTNIWLMPDSWFEEGNKTCTLRVPSARSPGGSIAFPVKTLVAGNYDITITACALDEAVHASTATLSLRVNDRTTSSSGGPSGYSITSGTPTTTAPIRMTLPAGLSTLVLKATGGAGPYLNIPQVSFTPAP